jgi:hypothetical protein
MHCSHFYFFSSESISAPQFAFAGPAQSDADLVLMMIVLMFVSRIAGFGRNCG